MEDGDRRASLRLPCACRPAAWSEFSLSVPALGDTLVRTAGAPGRRWGVAEVTLDAQLAGDSLTVAFKSGARAPQLAPRRLSGLSALLTHRPDDGWGVGRGAGSISDCVGSRWHCRVCLAQDEQLREAVDKHGARNWKAIAKHLEDRTDVQCLHRWQKVLRPGLVKGPWTDEVRHAEHATQPAQLEATRAAPTKPPSGLSGSLL